MRQMKYIWNFEIIVSKNWSKEFDLAYTYKTNIDKNVTKSKVKLRYLYLPKELAYAVMLAITPITCMFVSRSHSSTVRSGFVFSKSARRIICLILHKNNTGSDKIYHF